MKSKQLSPDKDRYLSPKREKVNRGSFGTAQGRTPPPVAKDSKHKKPINAKLFDIETTKMPKSKVSVEEKKEPEKTTAIKKIVPRRYKSPFPGSDKKNAPVITQPDINESIRVEKVVLHSDKVKKEVSAAPAKRAPYRT